MLPGVVLALGDARAERRRLARRAPELEQLLGALQAIERGLGVERQASGPRRRLSSFAIASLAAATRFFRGICEYADQVLHQAELACRCPRGRARDERCASQDRVRQQPRLGELGLRDPELAIERSAVCGCRGARDAWRSRP